MRRVHAPFLLHGGGLGRGIKGAIRQSFGDKNDDVLQIAVGISQNILRGHAARMELGATRICIHAYMRRRRPLAPELHGASYDCRSRSGIVVSWRTTAGRFASREE